MSGCYVLRLEDPNAALLGVIYHCNSHITQMVSTQGKQGNPENQAVDQNHNTGTQRKRSEIKCNTKTYTK